MFLLPDVKDQNNQRNITGEAEKPPHLDKRVKNEGTFKII